MDRRFGAHGGALYILQTCDDQAADGEHAAGLLVVVEAREIEKSGRIALYGIHFATNKADVTPDSAKTLEQIAERLKNPPDWQLRVEGHTDNVGNAKANLALSKKRAAAVKDSLVKQLKVDAKRLTTEGYGDTRPLGPNTDEAGEPAQLVTEFEVLQREQWEEWSMDLGAPGKVEDPRFEQVDLQFELLATWKSRKFERTRVVAVQHSSKDVLLHSSLELSVVAPDGSRVATREERLPAAAGRSCGSWRRRAPSPRARSSCWACARAPGPFASTTRRRADAAAHERRAASFAGGRERRGC